MEAWAPDGQLWCRHGDKLFPASTQNVAHERDFYRLQEMSAYDLAVVHELAIKPLEPDLRKIAEGWIPHFTVFFDIKRKYEDTGSDELHRALDEYINNLEEDMLGGLEKRAIPLLDDLRNKGPTIFADPEEAVFHTWFLAAQYFRTSSMFANVTQVLRSVPGFNAEASFGLMRTIYSCNVGRALWLRRHTLRLTYLRSEVAPLVTGDQPIVNMRANDLEPGTPPQELELYYPVSPRLGVLLDFDASDPGCFTKQLSKEESDELNMAIARRSKQQLYGATRESLADLR